MPKTIKVVIIGEANAGKTQLRNRLSGKADFNPEYKPTIGVDFVTYSTDNETTVQCFDVAGQTRFQSDLSSIYQDADLFLYALDLTNKDALNNMHFHIAIALMSANNPNTPVIIVGTKFDLEDKIVIDDSVFIAEIGKRKDNHVFDYILTSTAGNKDVNIASLRKMIRSATCTDNPVISEEAESNVTDRRIINNVQARGGIMNTRKAQETRLNKARETFSVVILGAKKAGKTELVKALLANKEFDETYSPTNIVRFTPSSVKDTNIKFNYLEANEENKTSTYNTHINAQVILCVFDLTDRTSFETARNLVREAKPKYVSDAFFILVGTKSDLDNQLQDDEVNSYLDEGVLYIKTSAKTKENITELHNEINKALIAKYNRRIVEAQVLPNTPENGIRSFINLSNDPLLNKQLEQFLIQANRLKKNESEKKVLINFCKEAVLDALTGKTNHQKKEALRNLHTMAASLSNTKQLKALAICMMAIGTVLAIVGALSIAVSMGAIATGVLAPLGVLTLGGGAAMTALGAASIIGGAGLFAARHKLFNPIDSINKIEHSLKKNLK